jgi:hypothetical protein
VASNFAPKHKLLLRTIISTLMLLQGSAAEGGQAATGGAELVLMCSIFSTLTSPLTSLYT